MLLHVWLSFVEGPILKGIRHYSSPIQINHRKGVSGKGWNTVTVAHFWCNRNVFGISCQSHGLNIFVSSLIWWFQRRNVSKITPRYFILGYWNILISFCFSTILWLNCFLGGLKIINSLLVTLIERQFAHNH